MISFEQGPLLLLHAPAAGLGERGELGLLALAEHQVALPRFLSVWWVSFTFERSIPSRSRPNSRSGSRRL